MSITPRAQPDCRRIGLSRFLPVVACKDDGIFAAIDEGYSTAQIRRGTVGSSRHMEAART
jgi:hypothetical protein